MYSLKRLSHWDLINMYDELLDDGYGDVSVAGYTYSTSDLLKNVDKIAYEVGFNDFTDNLECDECGNTGYDYCKCCEECLTLHDEDEQTECLNSTEVQ